MQEKIIQKEIKAWVASDGTEFENDWQCRQYEQKIEMERIDEQIESVPHVITCADSVEFSTSRAYDSIAIFKPRNEAEIELINQWLEAKDAVGYGEEIDADDYEKFIDGGVVVFYFDDGCESEVFGPLMTINEWRSSYEEHIDDVLRELDYE